MDISADIRTMLAGMPLFEELTSEQRERIVCRVRRVRAERGQILFHRGEEARGIHVVLSGQVKLSFVSSSGDEKVVDILNPGQSFGEAVVFMECNHVVTAQTLAPTLLVFVPRDVVFEEIDREPRLARRIIAALARRLHHLMRDLEAHSMHTGKQRLIGYLLHDCRWGRGADGVVEIVLPASKGTIASRLNLTQESLSRFLRELSVEGCIAVKGRCLRVLDPVRLRTLHG